MKEIMKNLLINLKPNLWKIIFSLFIAVFTRWLALSFLFEKKIIITIIYEIIKLYSWLRIVYTYHQFYFDGLYFKFLSISIIFIFSYVSLSIIGLPLYDWTSKNKKRINFCVLVFFLVFVYILILPFISFSKSSDLHISQSRKKSIESIEISGLKCEEIDTGYAYVRKIDFAPNKGIVYLVGKENYNDVAVFGDKEIGVDDSHIEKVEFVYNDGGVQLLLINKYLINNNYYDHDNYHYNFYWYGDPAAFSPVDYKKRGLLKEKIKIEYVGDSERRGRIFYDSKFITENYNDVKFGPIFSPDNTEIAMIVSDNSYADKVLVCDIQPTP